ncbi:MAG: bifunctional riboflavin kinase/FAD synthetase [Sphingomonadales bacterium]|nr:bifunctional riboflavin kinase/FAD synthetase [Sphingomonadales bacterium]
MKTRSSLISSIEGQEACVIALGNFDGFHRGHQVVIGEAGRIAKELALKLAVFTTEPHPRSYFLPDQENYRLTPLETRCHLLETFGVDIHYVLNFDDSLAATDANTFVSDVLLKSMGAKHIVVGYDYHFGKGREGNVELLKTLSKKLGFELTVINPVAVGVEGAAGEIYSSSLVRDVLKKGEARRAAGLLGHWWSINGVVVHGEKRGRELGYPTANVNFGQSIIPLHGIYAVRLTIEGRDKQYEGVANIGDRPTFDVEGELLEVYIFDFDEEIYGLAIEVDVVGFIRIEEKFDSIEALVIQIEDDCVVAKQILADPENDKNHLKAPSLESYLKMHPKPHDKI